MLLTSHIIVLKIPFRELLSKLFKAFHIFLHVCMQFVCIKNANWKICDILNSLLISNKSLVIRNIKRTYVYVAWPQRILCTAFKDLSSWKWFIIWLKLELNNSHFNSLALFPVYENILPLVSIIKRQLPSASGKWDQCLVVVESQSWIKQMLWKPQMSLISC